MMAFRSGGNFNPQKEVANDLFRKFLTDFTLSEAEKVQGEQALVALPTHLKNATRNRIDSVVVFPFGTFYHGIGFKDDPLTAYVCTGTWLGKTAKGKSRASKLVPYDVNESDDGECSSTESSNESDSSSSEEQDISKTWDQGRMRQSLLLDINDTLVNPENEYSVFYQDISLTRHGKLYYNFQRHKYAITESTADISTISNLHCLLEAKSFLPVQTSRLIKFYCILEQLFWPFSQLVLNWARNNAILETAGKTDCNGLKQEHIHLLVIFFLVRRHIIPSFKMLQKWSSSSSHQLIIDGINVAFCEDIDEVRRNCAKMGIGSSGLEECNLERILQLLYEFFHEVATFDWTDQGVSPSSGTTFSKYGEGPVLSLASKRKLDTNSLLCIQDVMDQSQNVTKKVKDVWVVRLKSRCRDTAHCLFPMLWTGDLLSATLKVLDVDVAFQNFDDIDMIDSSRSHFDLGLSMGQLRRCIKFRVPPNLLQLLLQCYEHAEVNGDVGGELTEFKLAVKTLFQKFMEEFNDIFWNKLAAALLIQTTKGGDPVYFEFVDRLRCPAKLSKDEKSTFVAKSVMNMLANWAKDSAQNGRFYVKLDWTKESRRDILLEQVDKSKAGDIVTSFLDGIGNPKVIYGQRYGPPNPPRILAAIELDVKFEEKGLYLYTFVNLNEAAWPDDIVRLNHYLDWYNVLIKAFVVKKYIKWMGTRVMKDLEERYVVLLGARRLEKMKAKKNYAGKTGPTFVAPSMVAPISSPFPKASESHSSLGGDIHTRFFAPLPQSIDKSSNVSFAVKSRSVKVVSQTKPQSREFNRPLNTHPFLPTPYSAGWCGVGRGRGRGQVPGRTVRLPFGNGNGRRISYGNGKIRYN